MKRLIADLLRPSAELPPDVVDRLGAVRDWSAFSTQIDRTGCAALAHTRLRDHEQCLPENVRSWLREQHNQTVENNTRLLEELSALTARLSVRDIRALVLKGPILGLWGTGLETRVFHDLDLLVRSEDLACACDTLRSTGFTECPSGNPYHRIFVRMAPSPPVIVELHFDLVDGERRYVPELAGVWDRAVIVELPGCAVSAPGIADHLLLTVMQLPHHLWSLRLLVDVAHITARFGSTIDWAELADRSQAWRMRALSGATIHAAASLFQLLLPPEAARFAEPQAYIQRVQWRLVLEAFSEQLQLRPSRFGQAVSWLIFDQPGTALALLVDTLIRTGSRDGWSFFPSIGRRLRIGAASLPALVAILSGTPLGRYRGMFPEQTRKGL